MAHALGLPRMQLYLTFDRPLSSAELEKCRDLVQRRGRREPLQYIVGSTSFCGLELAVNRHVLVPRPETELLAETAWEFLNRTAKSRDRNRKSEPGGSPQQSEIEPSPSAPQVLDFGTGSGCLAIALAAKCPTAQIEALDSSPEALETARQNAARHGLLDRIRFIPGDGFSAIPAGARFDLLVSNPPYIPSAELVTLQPEVRDYEPRAALDGGSDGLEFFRRLATEGRGVMKPGGTAMLEFGDGQGEAVGKLFEAQNWVVEKILEDYTRRPRILIARR